MPTKPTTKTTINSVSIRPRLMNSATASASTIAAANVR